MAALPPSGFAGFLDRCPSQRSMCPECFRRYKGGLGPELGCGLVGPAFYPLEMARFLANLGSKSV